MRVQEDRKKPSTRRGAVTSLYTNIACSQGAERGHAGDGRRPSGGMGDGVGWGGGAAHQHTRVLAGASRQTHEQRGKDAVAHRWYETLATLRMRSRRATASVPAGRR
jgi:hypothetical protein